MEAMRERHKKVKLPEEYRKQLDSRFLVGLPRDIDGWHGLLAMSGAPISAVLKIISEYKELPIIFWGTFEKAGVNPSAELDISLKNVTVEETLLGILSYAAPTGTLDFKFEKGSIRVFATDAQKDGK